jgi:indole-3-glycerol phosphate synthase
MMTSEATDVLGRICADKRADVAARRLIQPQDELKAAAREAGKPRGFARALMDAAAAGRPGMITEIKKASPSGGVIREDFDPAELAQAYAANGAACLSVLTDERYFQGTPAHLQAARAAVPLPVLRKDFILDEWQIYESRAMGADCVLLIMAAIEDQEARDLEALARALDMDVLVEVHNESELERALGLQTPLLGINNRNLKTLVTSIDVTEELSRLCPPDKFLISESGIRLHADIVRLNAVGVQGYLVGEALMRKPDVGKALAELLGGA